jgi:aspartate/methionine/tyrosine aminotransferase
VRVAEDLLARTGVLVTPGIVFGAPYDGFVRISAVVTEERMREVIAALTGMPVA